MEENERNWAENFAKEMIAKRHQVDAGDATVSDLQIYYLQHDPASWINKSADVLDEANRAVRKTLDDSNASASATSLVSTIITTVGTLLAVILGGVVAFNTAKSIKDPAVSPDRSGAQRSATPATSTRRLISIATTKSACSPRISTR